jgi:hypothetical protein
MQVAEPQKVVPEILSAMMNRHCRAWSLNSMVLPYGESSATAMSGMKLGATATLT